MRVLVLGGNGFIGSYIVDALQAVGCRVRVFDRSPNRYQDPYPNVDYRIGSFGDTAQMAEALQDVDLVFHLISTTVPSTSNLDPVGDIDGNLIGTVKLLEQMVKLNVKRIVYLSSGGTVYGNPTVEVVPTSHPLNPICSYGVVKVAIENYLHMFNKLHGIEPVVLRASNPFGPRQGHVGVQGIIPSALKRIIDGEPIQIWGDGSVVRDYIYVTDLVSLCIKAGFGDAVGVFNAGSGVGHSLNELLEIFARVSGQELNVDYSPGREFDVQRITLDISEASEAFDWYPAGDIEPGIRDHWEWLKALEEVEA